MTSGGSVQALDVLRRIWKASDEFFVADLSTPERSVLAALLVHANKRWEGWPSITTIEKGTDLHRSTVTRALNKLESRGLIVRDRKPPRPTKYRLSGAIIAPASRSMHLVAQGDYQADPEVVAQGNRASRTGRHELNSELPRSFVREEVSSAHVGAGTREDAAAPTTVTDADTGRTYGPADLRRIVAESRARHQLPPADAATASDAPTATATDDWTEVL